jgi:hypothetical protein
MLEAGRATGGRWHAIIGRALYEQADIRSAVRSITAELDHGAER